MSDMASFLQDVQIAHSVFLATGGNRHPAAADWDPEGSGLLAYGANSNIALWKPLDVNGRGVSAILSGHTDTVNVVKFWPTRSSNDTVILSGSADKTIRIWRNDENSPTGFEEAGIITHHQSSLNCIAVWPGSSVFVSGAADATVKIWKVNHPAAHEDFNVQALQSISLVPKFFPLAVALAQLDSSSLVLAVAGTQAIVQIYVSTADQFKHVATLTGHEGWIRALAFIHEKPDEHSDLLLASASQDKYIRLWRLHQGEELPAISNAASDPSLGAFGKSLSNKAHRFEVRELKYSITFEALLVGHEDWIYSAAWNSADGRLRLLSASADNSLAMWEPDPSSGIWICKIRLGEISAQKGSTTATGSTGGFWIGLWSPKGDAVVSLGRTGSWRLWKHESSENRWLQDVAISGHVKEVKGIAWSRDGQYLLSTGSDQTTRLYAQWKHGDKSSWHEFSRPQIHGYDLNCIDSIGNSTFISGAEEKLLRVFDEPGAVADILSRLCGIHEPIAAPLPDAANIPVLGLSNKAIKTVSDDELDGHAEEKEPDAADPGSVINKSTLHLDHPPFEDHLARHMLWPESEKLYGHGYEISAVAASHDGTVVATACRASSIEHAVIRLYETSEWREVKPPLTAHSLTVTGLKFSDDSRYLLSVGRDRQWTVFGRINGLPQEYRLALSNPKGHTRMILDASWAPSDAGRIFATAGRDKCVKIWRMTGTDALCTTTIAAASPVTTVAFNSRLINGCLVLAHGTEDGTISICYVETENCTVAMSRNLDKRIVPSRQINQLSWRPVFQDGEESTTNGDTGSKELRDHELELAVASDDSSVRLYHICR